MTRTPYAFRARHLLDVGIDEEDLTTTTLAGNKRLETSVLISQRENVTDLNWYFTPNRT